MDDAPHPSGAVARRRGAGHPANAAELCVTVISILRLRAREGADLAAAYAQIEIFEHSRRSGGFLGGRLLRELDGGGYLVMAEWEDVAAYQGWLDNPMRREVNTGLEPLLLDDVASGELFEEVCSAPGRGGDGDA
jgi:quinol monooxygenase YgiN